MQRAAIRELIDTWYDAHKHADLAFFERILADGAQNEADVRAPEDPSDQGDHGEGNIDEQVVAEQQFADERQVGEAWNVEVREGWR